MNIDQDSNLLRPYYIQRATIRTPLADPTANLTNAVKLDYMGSAEFEFGALPKSLRRLEAQQSTCQLRLVPELLDGETPLRVYSALSDRDFTSYVEFLLELRNSVSFSVRLKERSEFSLDERKPWGAPAVVSTKSENPAVRRRKPQRPVYERTFADFWWDIDNDVMWSFHKIFMNRLPEHLAASFVTMNTKPAA
jgi:hypothetical protein